jgi:hypothetical protein
MMMGANGRATRPGGSQDDRDTFRCIHPEYFLATWEMSRSAMKCVLYDLRKPLTLNKNNTTKKDPASHPLTILTRVNTFL